MNFFFCVEFYQKRKGRIKEVTYSFLIGFIFYVRVNRLMTCEETGKKITNTDLMPMKALCIRTRSCGDV